MTSVQAGGADDFIALFQQAGAIAAVAFSPNSAWLASVGRDKTVRLWSLADDPGQNPVVLTAPEGTIAHLAFSPEGRWLTAANRNNQSYVWNLSPDDLKARACAAAGRNLTIAEWNSHLPELSYNQTCPNL